MLSHLISQRRHMQERSWYASPLSLEIAAIASTQYDGVLSPSPLTIGQNRIGDRAGLAKIRAYKFQLVPQALQRRRFKSEQLMEVPQPDELPSRAASRPMAAAARVALAPVAQLGLSGRQRSGSLDNERSWRPASGFASKHQAEMEAKRLHRERQMQRARQMQLLQDEKKRREAELAKGPKPNDNVIVEEGEWKTVVSHGRRARNDRRTTHATAGMFLPLPPGPPTLGFSQSLDGPSVSAAVSAGRSLSQDEMEAADVARRKRRQQMKRRQKTPSQREEAKMESMNGVPHPSLLGEVMFARRSSLQRLADKLHVDDAVAVHSTRQAGGNAQRRSPTGVVNSPDYGMRKAKSTSSMVVNHQRGHYHNDSAESSPRGHAHHAGNRANRRSSSRLDSPHSPRSGSDSHGSPRPRKCGDKRDFFFRNLDYELRRQLQVDEVAEFSVTDFEMATKISQAVLDLFAPPKDDTTSESGNEDHEDGSTTTEERKKFPLVVTDGTACVGGNVLSFCDFFTHVNAIENDCTRVKMLRHNVQVLQKTNAKCIHANYLDVMLELQQDVVFLDPPWGGPEYKDLEKVDLFLGGLPLHEICTRLQGSAKCIVLKVPSNFDGDKFSKLVPGKVVGPSLGMSFGGFGSSSTPASGGFGGFGSGGGGFGSSAAASPFGGGAATGGFGAAAAKPSFGGFGAAAPAAGGGFGAQQPAASGFGGFGSSAAASTGFGAAPSTGFGAATPATTSGFGAASAFGGGATTGGFGSSGTSAFGASTPFGAKPAASPSPFGATSAFGAGAGTTSAFGGGATTGGFGTPTPASGGMFGGSSGGFGASAAKSPFGATSTATTGGFGAQTTGATGFGGFGAQQPAAGAAPGQVQVGTGQPPYQPTREMEPSGTGGTANYISISRMPAYSHKSTEELRYEDYLKRTNPAAAQAAATQNAPAPAPGATTGGTGAFGGFGAQPATSSAFGSAGGFGSSQPSAFGATSTGGGFGSSAFGSTTAPTTTGGFGGFGAQPAAPATSGGLFGNNAARPATGAFGAPATSSAFGAAPATSAFGAPATGGGFGSTTGGFVSSFGAAPATQQQTGGLGGFGTTTPAASSGFGASAFGKPAASSGFGGFGTTTTPAAAPAAGGFGFGATQPQAGATTSLFGGAGAAAPASSGFSFGATAPKPAATGGFGFGSTGGTSAFGSTTGGAFGATATPSAFGTTPAQPAAGTTSLFGGAGATTGSTGGFGFGTTTPSATPGATSSLFGGAKPATTSLFGSTTGTATSGSLFGNTGTGGSSLFGGTGTATNTGTSGFGFGTGGGFGSSTTGGFGSFGTPATSAAQTGAFGTTGSLFGQPQQPAQAAAAQPQNLVAAPDVNPYGAGSFGAGLVEQNVKAALDLQSIKTGSSASSRLTTFADDVGLPRGPLDPPLVTRRQTVSNRHAIPVSFIRGSFKGSKSRFSTFASPALSATPSSAPRPGVKSNGDGGAKEDEFKFTSSLFRNSVTKKLVIEKGDQTSTRGASSHVSVVPISDSDRSDVHEIGSARSRLLKPGDDGKCSVTFCNQTNKKSFTLRLYPNHTVKQARSEVKQLLRDSSTSTASSIVDIELVLKGRIIHDASAIEELQLKDGDSIDVVVIEDRALDKKREDHTASVPSMTKKPEAQSSEETAPPKRFMTYDEYLASASREEDDLFKDTEANGGGSVSPAASSCPVLKNKDYYTIPSYERLQAMTDHELSQVEKFTVGCRGLGAVEWIGKTDVRNLDLDELVFFEKKEVIVYKDDEKKHELGKGLNKPAIVELLGIFPPRKSASPEKYKERVKQRTQDIGATYLDYSIDKGIWRFRVEHFSRYGFDDDDDDEDVDMDGVEAAENPKSKEFQMDQLPRKTGMARGHMAVRGKMSFSADRSGLFRQSGIYGGEVTNNNVVASFGDNQAPSSAIDKWTGMSDDSGSVGPESSLMDLNAEEEVAAKKKDQRPTSEVFPVIPYSLKPLGVNSNADHLPPAEKSTTYQMMLQASNQPQTKVVRNHVDGGMFMARSFRCSWGPNGELVNLGKLTTRDETYSNVENKGRRVCIEFPLRLSETRKNDIHEGLKLHYDYTSQGRNPNDDIDQDGSEIPAQFALPVHEPLMSCLHKYVANAENRVKKAPGASFEKSTLLLWKLVQALWGQEHGVKMDDRPDSAFHPLASRDSLNEVETLDTFQTVDLRREAISQWFEAALKSANSANTFESTPSPEGVLRLLCQHRIAEASDMALDCGDFRLATLLAQAASYEGAEFRHLMETQLVQWSENGALEFMDKTLVLVYSVLAGNAEVLTAQKGASMSWIECLALFLWYKRGPATSLKDAVAFYEDAVSKNLASGSVSKFANASSDKDDVLMELLKLYIEDVASLCKVLSPSGFMSQGLHHLDYELSWHLHSVLRAFGYKLDRQWESHIHQNFIRQLEGSGLWEDAVYVALNISDAVERDNTCRELLFRNADVLASEASKREELCERLGVPSEWISEALAVRAVVKQERHEEIAHWIAARHYEEAHRCLISHVAMRCLFIGEKDVLMQLLLDLEPMCPYIPQWKSCEKVDAIGGGLLLEYLRLEQQKGLKVGREDQFLQRVTFLSQQLSSARDASAKDAKREKDTLVAQTCVSSMIVSLATQAVQLRSLLSYTQERELLGDGTSASTPLELEPEFLGNLAHLVTGRETSFVESYRTSQLMHLCSTFIDWRA
ncbi:unnamed protein product [Phytophthora lilii]|uniref:Trimethylguanosine synthase n=1 Tax=Phytophthora lilii TaxID=2077276 RepID=A0A9W6TYX2_9STRA|nr:unnamed protein product [Phytophthora lilii]